MEINNDILDDLVMYSLSPGMKYKKISCKSFDAANALLYLAWTVPKFNTSAVCKSILEQALEEEYTELWTEVKLRIPENSKKTYPFNWQKPIINENLLKKTWDCIAGNLYRETISVYSPRVTVTLEYLSRTVPKFNISEYCRKSIETELKTRLPELWNEIILFWGDSKNDK
jgi:post-segregation antitoxin (ccd killing protein)